MHKIKLTGTISLSSDLFNRLVSRGLLDTSHACTADFLQFIQECIARDDMRCNIGALSVEQQTFIPTESNDEHESIVENEANNQKSIESVFSAVVGDTNLAELQKSMNTLYQGG